jgi:hypothetical protein
MSVTLPIRYHHDNSPRSGSAPLYVGAGQRARANELTLITQGRHTERVSGPDSRAELSDNDLVESVLRDLREAAAEWESLVAEAESVTYSVDLGDIHAVANSDGRLIELMLHPAVVTDYTHGELTDRLNLAFGALREEAEADYQERYGGGVQ